MSMRSLKGDGNMESNEELVNLLKNFEENEE